MKLLLFIIIQALAICAVTAQKGINPETIAAEFPGQNAVMLEQHYRYVFDMVRDTLSVKQQISQKVLMLSQHTMPFTTDYVYFNDFSSIEDLEAYTLVPRKGSSRYVRVDAGHFSEAHDRENSIFYNDSKTKQFAYPSLQQNAITNLNYTVVYHDPMFLRHCYFQSAVPVLSAKVQLKVHRDIEIGFKLYNDNDADIQFRQYSRGRYTYYEWEMKDVPPSRYADTRFFGLRHHSPHLAVYVKTVNQDVNLETYYDGVDELYRFYRSLMKDMDVSHTAPMKALVDDLTEGLSQEEKIRAIYYWVQQNIRYVAYVDGYNGFIPAPPAEVFSKRFGDCKGMSVLMQKMLDLAGIQAWLAWVGTRDIPYTYQECPLPSVDNHMVVALEHNGDTLILDATFNYLDLGSYPYHIKGKEVLIGISEQDYRLFTVPVSHYSQNTVVDSVLVSINAKTLEGKGNRTHKGFNKLELAYAMRGVPANDYKKKFTALFEKGNNKFRVNSWDAISLFDYDVPSKVSYHFTLEDYVMRMDDEIYVNLNLDRSHHTMKMDTTIRFSPVVNDFPFKETHVTQLLIPDGYNLSFIPEDEEFVGDSFRASFRYKHDGDYVTLTREIVFDFLVLGEDRFEQWNAMIAHLVKNYRLSVVLKQNKIETTP
ncbi:MAG: DUF3857 domain-containing protein [Bacteroidota bacterium]